MMVQLAVFETEVTENLLNQTFLGERAGGIPITRIIFVCFCWCVLNTAVSTLDRRGKKSHGLDAETSRARVTHI